MQELIGLNPLIRKQTTNKQQDVYILLIGAGRSSKQYVTRGARANALKV